MKKLYDQREVSKLTGISESQIRYWDRQGLITHLEKDRGRLWFDFQSLVAFRTVRDLRRQGVSLRQSGGRNFGGAFSWAEVLPVLAFLGLALRWRRA